MNAGLITEGEGRPGAAPCVAPPGDGWSAPLRILLADDHQMLRQRIRALLEQEGFEVVGEASDGREAVRLARHFSPDMVILDYSMPALNGLAAAGEILRDAPLTRAILLTLRTEAPYVLKAIQAGVRGYVAKSRMPDDLLAAIRDVARGRMYQSPALSETAAQAGSSRAVFTGCPSSQGGAGPGVPGR